MGTERLNLGLNWLRKRNKPESVEPIIDSNLTREEALSGIEIPNEIQETLILTTVQYRSFDNRIHQGQLVLHKDIADEAVDIFEELFKLNFPIEITRPIVAYNWSDTASMQANNTSAFNYRTIDGTDILSLHGRGLAIDINPRLNPCVYSDNTSVPDGAVYDPDTPGTLTPQSDAVRAFTSRGWTWGGDWNNPKDWQHFQKKI